MFWELYLKFRTPRTKFSRQITCLNKNNSDQSSIIEATYKGIGSLMIELARGICVKMRTHGAACRFITVDADIEKTK